MRSLDIGFAKGVQPQSAGASIMLTVRELAAEWSVSPGIIYKLVNEGKLRCHRIGSAIRFAKEHLKQYLDASEVVEHHQRQTFSHLDL